MVATEQKKLLRKQMRGLRDAASAEDRAAWSAVICARAIALPEYQRAQVVHCFISMSSEVDTRAIIEHALAHGKRVVIPLFLRNSAETPCCEIDTLDESAFMVSGFGLRVPREKRWVDAVLVDVVFVPLLAFAPTSSRGAGEQGRKGARYARLGYGAGYYDAFLSRVHAPAIGVAFELQRVGALPLEPHDQLLDAVLTELR
jgi:5-formyltetrahydrofolate cyclo-ligase